MSRDAKDPNGIGQDERRRAGDVPPIPWTSAYQDRRQRSLHAAVRDPELLSVLAAGGSLPSGYGIGLDERCVEYPWVFAHLPDSPGRLLDAGSALNHQFLLSHAGLLNKRIHIVTLVPEADCFYQRGISYVYEDLRQLPFAAGLYDTVVSVSTIEHVGCDNTYYTGTRSSDEPRLRDFAAAILELRRVTAPGGLLLLTVPYGRYQYHGAFQQFDREHLSIAEAALGAGVRIEETFFLYDARGWQRSTDAACSDAEYVAWVSEVMRTGVWPTDPSHEPDFAAAARAIACVAARVPIR
jgi:SAM-dependent methyltransferase